MPETPEELKAQREYRQKLKEKNPKEFLRIQPRSRDHIELFRLPEALRGSWSRAFGRSTPWHIGHPLITWLRHGDIHGRRPVPMNRLGWLNVNAVAERFGCIVNQLCVLTPEDRKKRLELLGFALIRALVIASSPVSCVFALLMVTPFPGYVMLGSWLLFHLG